MRRLKCGCEATVPSPEYTEAASTVATYCAPGASGSAAGPVYVFAFAAPGAARPGGECSGGGSGGYDG